MDEPFHAFVIVLEFALSIRMTTAVEVKVLVEFTVEAVLSLSAIVSYSEVVKFMSMYVLVETSRTESEPIVVELILSEGLVLDTLVAVVVLVRERWTVVLADAKSVGACSVELEAVVSWKSVTKEVVSKSVNATVEFSTVIELVESRSFATDSVISEAILVVVVLGEDEKAIIVVCASGEVLPMAKSVVVSESSARVPVVDSVVLLLDTAVTGSDVVSMSTD